MSWPEVIKDKFATTEDEYIIRLMGMSEKTEAAVKWCVAKYGDATIMHDMLCEIAGDMQDFMSELYDRKEDNHGSN